MGGPLARRKVRPWEMVALVRQGQMKQRFLVIAQGPEVGSRRQTGWKTWEPLLIRVWVGWTVPFIDETRLMRILTVEQWDFHACVQEQL